MWTEAPALPVNCYSPRSRQPRQSPTRCFAATARFYPDFVCTKKCPLIPLGRVAAHKSAPRRIVLDLDATDDPWLGSTPVHFPK